MTERQRLETTYKKVQKKHPHIANESTLKELALKTEWRRTLWISVGFLWGSILCMILYVLLPDNDYTDILIGCSLVFFIVCSFEYFRTVLNSEKIKYHYLCEHNTKNQGTLTYEQIIKGKSASSTINEGNFKIIKAILYDKDDSDDSYVSWIYHKYHLYFKKKDSFTTFGFRVKRRAYLTAPLDAEYILVLSDSGKVISSHLSNAWKIDSDLFDFCEFNCHEHNTMLNNSNHPKNVTSKSNMLPFEIAVCVLNVLAYFLPIIFGIITLPFTTFFATRLAIRNKNALSIINIILGYCGVVLIFFFICL